MRGDQSKRLAAGRTKKNSRARSHPPVRRAPPLVRPDVTILWSVRGGNRARGKTSAPLTRAARTRRRQ